MKGCKSCGGPLPADAASCPRCGSKVDGTEVELVEKLTVEASVMSQRGFSFRVINSGTAPLEITRLLFDRKDSAMTGLSYGNGTLKGGHVFLDPGEKVDIVIDLPLDPLSAITYPVEIKTASGGSYPSRVAWP